MADDIIDLDLTNFGTFIDDYTEGLVRDFNKIVKVRRPDIPFQPMLTITNPEMVIDSRYGLVPKINVPASRRQYIYLTRTKVNSRRMSFYMKTTRYKADNYENTGLPLYFDAVNMLGTLVESDETHFSKRGDSYILNRTERREQGHEFAGQEWDMIHTKTDGEGKSVDSFYYSDQPWEDRFKLGYTKLWPVNIMSELFAAGVFEECRYNPNAKLNPDLVSSPTPEGEPNYKGFEIDRNLVDVYSKNTWVPREDAIVSESTSTKLVRFLSQSEVHIWASICANSLRRPIKDHELHFMRTTYQSLSSLHNTFLNSMTSVAFGMILNAYLMLSEFNILDLCQRCGRIMRKRHDKKYCSVASEGVGCAKKYHSKKYYQKNRDRITEYYREEMRENRAVIKGAKDKDSK